MSPTRPDKKSEPLFAYVIGISYDKLTWLLLFQLRHIPTTYQVAHKSTHKCQTDMKGEPASHDHLQYEGQQVKGCPTNLRTKANRNARGKAEDDHGRKGMVGGGRR